MSWQYKLDFVLFPLVAMIVTALTCRSLNWLVWCAAGMFLFSFAEYWIHRVVLHRLMWHGVHERHHLFPEEDSILPVYFTPAIFAGFFIVMPYPLFAGVTIAYVWFLYWHFALHRWRLEQHPWVRRYANWHAVHHRGLPKNFGISSPLWDFVFRTYVPAPRG